MRALLPLFFALAACGGKIGDDTARASPSAAPSGACAEDAAPRAPRTVFTASAFGDEELVADGTSIYFTTGQALVKLPLAGGDPITLATGMVNVYGMAADDDAVYWADFDQGLIQSVPKDGGPVTTIATGQLGASALAVAGSFVAWSTVGQGGGPPTGTVAVAPKTGGAPTTLVSGPIAIEGVLADATDVYWVEAGADPDWMLKKVPVAGGAPSTIAPIANLQGIASYGGVLYWRDGETLHTAPMDASGPRAFPGSSEMAVDASGVYWVNATPSGSSIARSALDGSCVETLTSSADALVSGVALGPDAAYYVRGLAADLLAVPK